MKELTISINIMVYNEERCIERCINSVINLADEIIIVDTGSTDKTIDIIKHMNCSKIKLYSHKWENDFSKIRNLMIEYSTKDIIFQIDADEYLDILSENKNIIYKNINSSEVLSPKIIDYYDTEYIGELGRIFLNNGKYTYYGKIHEELRYNNKKIATKKINLPIYHDGYLKEVVNKKEKGQRNIKLSEEMTIIEPSNCRWDFYLIKDLFNYSKDISKIIVKTDSFIEKYNKNLYTIHNSTMLEIVIYIRTFCIINNNLDIPYDIDLLIDKYKGNTDFIFLKLLKIKKQISDIEHEINVITSNLYSSKHKYSFFNSKNNHVLWLLSELLLNLKQYKKFMIVSNNISGKLKKEFYKNLFTDISSIYNFLKGEVNYEK